MIHRLSSKTIPGMAAAIVAMAATSSLTCFAQDSGKDIEGIIAKGDEAYVNNNFSEAVQLYRQAHDMLPSVNASPALKTLVNERYSKSQEIAVSARPLAHVGRVSASTAAGTSVIEGPVRSHTEQKAIASRDDKTQEAMVSLNKARELYREQKYEESLKEYQHAYEVMPDIPINKDRRQFIGASMADASVAVAQEYAQVGRYDEARTLLETALKAHPANKYAKAMLTQLDDPIRNNPAQTPQNAANVKEVDRLLLLGYGYYDLGKYDDAVKSFEAVLRIDPYNVAARRGMEAVEKRKTNYYNAAYDQTRSKALSDVTAGWENPVPRDGMPGADGDIENYVLDGTVKTVSVDDKARRIMIPRIDFENVDLMEAVEFLRRQAEVQDRAVTTAERGVNIIVNLGSPDSEAAKNILGKRFDLQINNISLYDAIQQVARLSGTIAYATTYSIEISSDATDVPFISKVISVPPGFFSSNSGAGNDTAAETDIFADASAGAGGLTISRVDPKEALSQMGIPFPEGASVRFNAQNSTLFVHNAPQNIRLIEEVVASKATDQPAQVVVSTTIIEVSEDTLKELGFDWIVNLNFDPNKFYGIGGGPTANANAQPPSIAGIPTPAGGLVTGGLRTTTDVMTTDSIDNLIRVGTQGISNGYRPGTAPGIFTIRGVWSQADVAFIMRGLDQKKGADVLQKPQIIVRPGEKVSFFSGRELIYPEEYEPPQIPTSSYGSSDSGMGDMIVAPANPTSFTKREIGTIFDVDITGINESKTIVSMVINPQVVEFDGFINYGSPITVPVIGSSGMTGATGSEYITNVEVTRNEILQPVFSKRAVTTPISIETGKTVVFAGYTKARTVEFEDKVPIFGDLPLVGRLFRSEGKQEQRQVMLMFVKAEVVDPAGRDLLTMRQTSASGDLNGGFINPDAASETDAEEADTPVAAEPVDELATPVDRGGEAPDASEVPE